MLVDLGTGEPITVGYVDEANPQAVVRWLKPLVQQHGVSVIATDDRLSYKVVAEKLQLGHQVCQFHVRRWVNKALKDLQETLPKGWRKKFDNFSMFCIQRVVNSCMPSGNNCRVVVLDNINHGLSWSNCVTCSCA